MRIGFSKRLGDLHRANSEPHLMRRVMGLNRMLSLGAKAWVLEKYDGGLVGKLVEVAHAACKDL